MFVGGWASRNDRRKESQNLAHDYAKRLGRWNLMGGELFMKTEGLALACVAAVCLRLSNARHMVFLSNEADVLREVNAFLDDLR
jgi:hypothetical protein